MSAFRIEPAAYRALLQVAPYPVLLAELDTGQIIDSNRAARRAFGHTTQGFCELKLSDLHAPEHQTEFAECMLEVCGLGRSDLERTAIVDSSGQIGWYSLSMIVERVGAMKIVVATYRDLSTQILHEQVMERTLEELQSAQSQLADSEAHYRAILHSAPDAVLITDFDSARFVEVNESAIRMFGYTADEFRNMTGRKLHPPEAGREVDEISRQLNLQGAANHEGLLMSRKDGSLFHASLRMNQLTGHSGARAYVTIVRDVSALIRQKAQLRAKNEELRTTQAQLIQASKMAAMGSLSAGIAHELNQPLTVIGGFASRIIRKQDSRVSEVHKDLDIIVREVSRMASIVGNVRQFGRQEELKLKRINAARPMELALQLMEAQCKDGGIRLERVLPEEPFEVFGDRGKLQQVFLNLLTNARDAVEFLPPEQRWIRTSVLPESDHVLYRVEDGGEGVEPDMQEKLFDPFFSTKGPDRGMGLGLSIAFSLISSHHGVLRYADGWGHGCFEVEVPTSQSHSRSTETSDV